MAGLAGAAESAFAAVGASAAAVPLWLLLAGHCTLVALAFRPVFRPYWLGGLLSTLLIAFGGNVASSALLGVAPVFLTTDIAAPIHGLAWYLVNHTRTGHAAAQSAPARLACVVLSATAGALAVAGATRAAMSLWAGRIVGPALVGLAAGTGGKMLADGALYFGNFPSRGGAPPELVSPGFVTFAAVAAVAAYLGLTHGPHVMGHYVMRPLSHDAAAGVLCLGYVGAAVYRELADLARPRITDSDHGLGSRTRITDSAVPVPTGSGAGGKSEGKGGRGGSASPPPPRRRSRAGKGD